jgi:hypothetical protein
MCYHARLINDSLDGMTGDGEEELSIPKWLRALGGLIYFRQE